MANAQDVTGENPHDAAARAVDQQAGNDPLDLPDGDPQWPGDPDPLPPADEPAVPGREDVNPDSPPGRDSDREQQGPDPSQYPNSLPPSHYKD